MDIEYNIVVIRESNNSEYYITASNLNVEDTEVTMNIQYYIPTILGMMFNLGGL